MDGKENEWEDFETEAGGKDASSVGRNDTSSQEEPKSEEVQPDVQQEKLADTSDGFEIDTVEDKPDFLKNVVNLDDELSTFEKKENEATENKPVVQQPEKPKSPSDVKIDISAFLTGATLILMWDKFYPGFLQWVCKLFKYEIPKVHLDEGEVNMLTPIADEVVKMISLRLNPIVAFLIVSNMFYFKKIKAGQDTDPVQAEKPRRKRKKGQPSLRLDGEHRKNCVCKDCQKKRKKDSTPDEPPIETQK